MATKSENRVLSFLKNNKEDFHEKYGIYSVGLFGSFAREEQTADSDIDIAIEMVIEKKNLHNFMAFKRYLEKEFDRKENFTYKSPIKNKL